MLDIALQFDATSRRCDVLFNGRDFALDRTAATPVLIALGSDRRARSDDELPQPDGDALAPLTLSGRRGWWGDALDVNGRRIGSRLWLLVRKKDTEATRKLAETILAEALKRIEIDLALPVEITVQRVRPGLLGYRVRVGTTTVSLQQGLAA